MRMDKENTFPKSFKNPCKKLFLIQIFEEESKFPNDQENSWEEVKSWKSWEKHKTALRNPKNGKPRQTGRKASCYSGRKIRNMFWGTIA